MPDQIDVGLYVQRLPPFQIVSTLFIFQLDRVYIILKRILIMSKIWYFLLTYFGKVILYLILYNKNFFYFIKMKSNEIGRSDASPSSEEMEVCAVKGDERMPWRVFVVVEFINRMRRNSNRMWKNTFLNVSSRYVVKSVW